MDYERIVKLAQNISFTTFLILCLAIMSYGIVRLYTDSRSELTQVQTGLQSVNQLDSDVETLVRKVDRLIEVCYPRSGIQSPAVSGLSILPVDR